MPKPIENFNKDDYTDKFIKNLYNKEWQDRHFVINRPKNKNFGRVLLEEYNWNSVVDYGCSIGSLLEVFLEAGKKLKDMNIVMKSHYHL